MSVDRYPYSEFTATDIYNRAENVGSKTNQTTYVQWDNILLSLLKTLIGTADESLIDAAADTLAEEVFKITGIRWSTEYKEPVLKSVFKRVLQKLL